MSDSDRASNRGTNGRKSDRPQKGKDQAEREELSLTRSHMEGNSKRTGSPRVPGEPTGRGGSLTRRCKRGDNAPGSNNETDAKKRRRALPGHSQRASAKPTTEADKATTKKERGKECVSDSDRASNRGTNGRKSDRPQKGKDQAEREELSLTRSHMEGNSKRTGSPRAPGEPTGRGGSLTRRRIPQA